MKLKTPYFPYHVFFQFPYLCSLPAKPLCSPAQFVNIVIQLTNAQIWIIYQLNWPPSTLPYHPAHLLTCSSSLCANRSDLRKYAKFFGKLWDRVRDRGTDSSSRRWCRSISIRIDTIWRTDKAAKPKAHESVCVEQTESATALTETKPNNWSTSSWAWLTSTYSVCGGKQKYRKRKMRIFSIKNDGKGLMRVLVTDF